MIPITIIGGYLGAGKTTLINRILACALEPIAVLVNDFGELNVDVELISNRDDMTLELTNGCVCCQITDDLGEALESIKSRSPKRVILEASGVALPAKIANYGRNWPGFSPAGVFTLVDSSNIDRLLQDKYVKHLVKAQIQEADQVLLTRLYGRPTPSELTVLSDNSFDLDCQSALPDFLTGCTTATAKPYPAIDKKAEFTATTFTADTPISKKLISEFISDHPYIQRAKGWLMDHEGDCWLLQMTLADCTFTKSSPRGKTEIQFIYTGTDALDMTTLRQYRLQS